MIQPTAQPDIAPDPSALKVLIDRKGFRVWRNPENGFTVARVHFTADPAKRDPRWEAEARRSIGSEALFEREYNIKFDALSGELVFPQFIAHKGRIVVRPPYPTLSEAQRCWASLDWGVRNPVAFHVYTMLPGESGGWVLNAIWELYEPAEAITDVAEKIKSCPYFDQIDHIAIDPDMTSQRVARDVASVAMELHDRGITNLVPAPKKEPPWLALMREVWWQPDKREPHFKIWETCPNMIEEFEAMRYQTLGPRQAEMYNPKEKMVDRKNHCIDGVKMRMLLTPHLVGVNTDKFRSERATREYRGYGRERWRRHLT